MKKDPATVRRQFLKSEVIRIHETEGGTLRSIVERLTDDPAERVIAYAAARGYYTHDQELCIFAMYRPLQRRRQKITDVSTCRLGLSEVRNYIEDQYQRLKMIAEGRPEPLPSSYDPGDDTLDLMEAKQAAMKARVLAKVAAMTDAEKEARVEEIYAMPDDERCTDEVSLELLEILI